MFIQGFDYFPLDQELLTAADVEAYTGFTLEYFGTSWFEATTWDGDYGSYTNSVMRGFMQSSSFLEAGGSMLSLYRNASDIANIANSNIFLKKSTTEARGCVFGGFLWLDKPSVDVPILKIYKTDGTETILATLWHSVSGELYLSETDVPVNGGSTVTPTEIADSKTKKAVMPFSIMAYLKLTIDCNSDSESIVSMLVDGHSVLDPVTIPLGIQSGFNISAVALVSASVSYFMDNYRNVYDDITIDVTNNLLDLYAYTHLSVRYTSPEYVKIPAGWDASNISGDSNAVGGTFYLDKSEYIEDGGAASLNKYVLGSLDLSFDSVEQLYIVCLGEIETTESLVFTAKARDFNVSYTATTLANTSVLFAELDMSEVYSDVSVSSLEYLSLELETRY